MGSTMRLKTDDLINVHNVPKKFHLKLDRFNATNSATFSFETGNNFSDQFPLNSSGLIDNKCFFHNSNRKKRTEIKKVKEISKVENVSISQNMF